MQRSCLVAFAARPGKPGGPSSASAEALPLRLREPQAGRRARRVVRRARRYRAARRARRASSSKKRGLAKVEARACTSSCLVVCWAGPVVAVEPDGYFSGRVTTADVPEIVEALRTGTRVERLVLAARGLRRATDAKPRKPRRFRPRRIARWSGSRVRRDDGRAATACSPIPRDDRAMSFTIRGALAARGCHFLRRLRRSRSRGRSTPRASPTTGTCAARSAWTSLRKRAPVRVPRSSRTTARRYAFTGEARSSKPPFAESMTVLPGAILDAAGQTIAA